jgi:hypothetical protein
MNGTYTYQLVGKLARGRWLPKLCCSVPFKCRTPRLKDLALPTFRDNLILDLAVEISSGGRVARSAHTSCIFSMSL